MLENNYLKSILLTKIEPKVNELAKDLESHSFQTTILPGIQIQLEGHSDSFYKSLENDKNNNWIFVSKNAVKQVLDSLNYTKNMKLLADKNLYAIGKSTAVMLTKATSKSVVYPNIFNTEALLKLDELKDVSAKGFTIFRGESGRNLLGDSLKLKGANIDYIACYHRLAPRKKLIKVLENKLKVGFCYDLIVFTSFESLKNIFYALSMPKLLCRSSITVTNERMFRWAEEQGFDKILLIDRMDNASLSKAILKYFRKES